VLHIRPATDSDRDAIWKIFHGVVAAGDTYVFDPNTSREDALAYWFRDDTHTYVVEQDSVGDAVSVPGKLAAPPTGQSQDRHVVGSYVLKRNQPALGSHVANASFIVAPHARGLGVGRAMGEHCLAEARRLGFRAMQFNFVVSTNESAIHLWEELGFQIVGTLPGAFRHAQKGYVDVYVMFRSLMD
jgi:ribosomal protein S18 acetylase RimI-like enzyme